MAFIPFARWRPDIANLNSTYTADTLNVLLSATALIPFRQLMPFSQALPADPVGGFTARNSAGQVEIFVGTATKLYKFNSTTLGWDHISRLGSDTVTNGTFASDTAWSKGTGVTITAGVGRLTAVSTATVALSQAATVAVGTIYKITYTISGFSAGAVFPRFSGGTNVDGTARTANGTYTDYLTGVTGNNTLAFVTAGTTTLDIDNVSMKALANYNASTDERWRFRQFGNYVVAVNINDPPQVFELGVSTEFANLGGSPPHARHIAVWGDFLVLMCISGNENRVHWSELNNITGWTPGVNNSDYQDFPDCGDVQGSTDATNPMVLLQRGVWGGTFVPGSVQVFTFVKLHQGRGAFAPYAIASRGDATFFIEAGGVSQLNADGTIAQIGLEKIDRTVFGQVDGTELSGAIGEVDPFFNRYYLALKVNSTSNLYDRLIVYDWGVGEFTQLDMNAGVLFPLSSGTVGYTLEGLDAVSAILGDLPYSLDSKVWQGGAPVMGAIDADRKLGFFSGDNAEATITTQEIGVTDGTVSRITEILPVIDSNAALVSIGGRFRRGDNLVFQAEAAQSANTGIVRKRSRARYHVIKVRIPAGTAWSQAQGINHDATPAGLR